MNSRFLLIKVISVALVALTILFLIFLFSSLIPSNSQAENISLSTNYTAFIGKTNLDGNNKHITLEEIEYLEYDRRIRGAIVHYINGREESFHDKPMKDWEEEYPLFLIPIDGRSWLVNKENACICNKGKYVQIHFLNSRKTLRSNHKWLKHVIPVCTSCR